MNVDCPTRTAPTEESLREQMVATGRRLHSSGWVANHDGNLSARLGGGLLLCSPTAVSKGDLRPEWLIVIDASGAVVQGTRRAFSELQLHRAAYAARPDIGAVVHAHPPHATGFAVAGVALDHPFIAEAVVSLGDSVPTVPYHRPGDPMLADALGRALGSADVVLLERHGVLSVGGSFEQALLRMELVEHLARIALVARQLGGVRPLPESDVAALTAKARPASDPDFGGAASATAPAAAAISGAGGPGAADPSAVVEQALKRFR